MATSKVTYTPFISKPIPESSALSPIPISFPISEYQGADPDREVIPIQYAPSKPKSEIETTVEEPSPFKWARLTLHSTPEIKLEETKSGKTYSDKKKFKSDLKSVYEKELTARGLNPEFADYIAAQDALESGWGSSSLSKHFNFGGIKETRKDKGVQKKTKESYDGKTLTDTVDSFRQFDSLDDYVKYKINLLGNSNYNVFAYRPDQMYNRLVTAKNKYATDPDYESKLNAVYKTYLAT